MNKDELLSDYLEFLHKQDYGKSTIYSYGFSIKLLLLYLDQTNSDLASLVLTDILKYLAQRNKEVCNGTLNCDIAAIKNFFGFLCARCGYTIRFDPEQVRPMRITRKEKNFIHATRLSSLLENAAMSATLNPMQGRDYILLALVAITGARISEIIKIKKADISGSKLIIGARAYFLDADLATFILEFIGKTSCDNEYLLVNYSTKRGKKGHITIRSAERMLRKNLQGHSFNELRLSFFYTLMQQLPDITQIHFHQTGEIENLTEIEKVI